MQKDVNRLKRKKAKKNKIIAIIVVSIAATLVMLLMRSCSNQLSETSHKKSAQAVQVLENRGIFPG